MMTSQRTRKECQSIIFKLGIQFGVPPRLISTRLLDDIDKGDMMAGELSIEALTSAVGAWKANDMPDYCNNTPAPPVPAKNIPALDTTWTYCKPFISWSEINDENANNPDGITGTSNDSKISYNASDTEKLLLQNT